MSCAAIDLPFDLPRSTGLIPLHIPSHNPGEAEGQRHVEGTRSGQYAESLTDAAVNFLRSGHLSLAIDSLRKAIIAAHDGDEPIVAIHAKSLLGYAYTISREFDRAESLFNECLVAAQESGDHLTTAGVLSNLGILHAAKSDYTRARTAFKHCIESADKTNNNRISASASLNLSILSLREYDRVTASRHIESAAAKVSVLQDSVHKAELLLSIGLIFQNLVKQAPELPSNENLIKRAYAAYIAAERIAAEANDSYSLCFATAYLGKLYALQKRYKEALQYTRRAAFIAQENSYGALNFQWHWQIARILGQQGKKAEAISAYRRAIRVRNTDGSSGIVDADSFSIPGENPISLNFELAELLIQRTESLKESSAIQDHLRQARQILESIKADELNAFLGDECVAASRAEIQEIDTVDNRTAVIYVASFTDNIELLVSIAAQLRRFTIPVANADFADEIKHFRQGLEERTTNRYLKHAQTLYGWLIAPLRAYLSETEVRTLVFVPSESLRNVPLSALHGGSHFLIEDYSIAVSPGLTLIGPTPTNWEDSRILLCGLSLPVAGFSGLEYVSDEVTALSALFEGRNMMNQKFVYDRFEHEINNANYSIVHIASHGVMQTDPKESFLLTFDGKIRMNDLERLLKPYQFRGTPVELLTLSACETAAGSEKAALGFAGLALKAGARSVLGTLWSINDAATSTLIQKFYAKFSDASGPSKAQALQHAQITMIQDQRYQHPCYWSPFILVGNWL